MMKAILVMEMPENCLKCPMEMDVEDTSGNKWQGNICQGSGKRNADKSKKPDWCPLVPMPERKNYEKLSEGNPVKAWGNGWNSCLEEMDKD